MKSYFAYSFTAAKYSLKERVAKREETTVKTLQMLEKHQLWFQWITEGFYEIYSDISNDNLVLGYVPRYFLMDNSSRCSCHRSSMWLISGSYSGWGFSVCNCPAWRCYFFVC